jgi:hypothetical protein
LPREHSPRDSRDISESTQGGHDKDGNDDGELSSSSSFHSIVLQFLGYLFKMAIADLFSS